VRADTSLTHVSLFFALSLVTELLSVGAKGKPFFSFGLSFSGADELNVNPALLLYNIAHAVLALSLLLYRNKGMF